MKTQSNIKKCILVIFTLFITTYAQSQSFTHVKDIRTGGSSSSPEKFAQYNSKLYFTASDATGKTLWESDGTTTGTTQVTTKNVIDFIVFNNEFYFSSGGPVNYLYKSDGTITGTQILKFWTGTSTSGPSGFKVFNNKLYFLIGSGNTPYSIWTTDGTETGTQLIKEFGANASFQLPYERTLTEYNGKLYFGANIISGDAELWVSDGTTSGTQAFININPFGASNPNSFKVYNGKLYFSANDDVNGVELWATDGTVSGTNLVRNIGPLNVGSDPRMLTVFQGQLYFVVDNNSSEEVWVTDGTTAGTTMVMDGFELINSLSPLGNKLFILAEKNQNLSIWQSNGTTSGTTLISNVASNNFYSKIYSSVVFNNNIYFSLRVQAKAELWVCNVISGISQRIQPLGASAAFHSMLSRELFEFNDELYFAASYDSTGNELWKLSASPLSLNNVIDNDLLNIYPNPTTDELFIKTDTQVEKIEIKNISGQVVKKEEGNFNKISTSELSNGIYFIQVSTKNNIITKEFLKQ